MHLLTIILPLLVVGSPALNAGPRSYEQIAARYRQRASGTQALFRLENTAARRTAAGVGLISRGGSAAQARLLAQRAADVRAMRNLAWKSHFGGRGAVSPPSGTGTVQFRTRMRRFELSRPQTLPGGKVRVRAQVPAADAR
jgi:hypothetical protein